MDFKEALTLLRRRWKSIVAAVLLALLASAALSLTATPVYASHARVFISNDARGTQDAYVASLFSAARVQSYADLADSHAITQRIIVDLGLNVTSSELANKIDATVAQDTVIIDIEARDSSARTAQRIAQADAEELSDYIAQVETPNGKSSTPIKATVVDPATLNLNPVSPRLGLNLAVAALIGLLLGIALAVVRELMDVTVKTEEEIDAVSGAPHMASIAYDSDVAKSPLITSGDGHAPRAEQFRVLRTNLQFVQLGLASNLFVITSPVASEGKTTTAVNLCITLAQSGKRVLLVEGDLRRGRVAEVFGLERAVGLTTALIGRTTLGEAVQVHTESGVHVLAGGPPPPNPSDLLESPATKEVLDQLSASYDVVVIDAPPLLPVADAAILARETAGAIMVVAHGSTTRDALRQACHRLDAVGARLLGTVVNKVPRRGPGAYGAYDAYSSSYAPLPAREKSR